MNANEVIETYIDDTVRLLPRRQRADVAIELRSLLDEELNARAQGAGRPPDKAMALSQVRDYGHPNEVAARYQKPWAIVDPADSTSFMRAAIIGASAIATMSALGGLRSVPPESSANYFKLGTLAWLGLLVVFFGTNQWIRRRWPATMLWKPRDRDRPNRVGTAVLVPFATSVIVLYAVPVWVLGHLLGGRFDVSWAAYTEEFQRWRLPWFIGLMAANLALTAIVSILGRWRRLTRRISIGINFALACLAIYFAAEGNIFQMSHVDRIARDTFALIAAGYMPVLGMLLYDEIGRLDRAPA